MSPERAVRVRTGVAEFAGIGWHVVVEIDGTPKVVGPPYDTETECELAAGVASRMLRDAYPHIDGPGAPVQ